MTSINVKQAQMPEPMTSGTAYLPEPSYWKLLSEKISLLFERIINFFRGSPTPTQGTPHQNVSWETNLRLLDEVTSSYT